MKAIYFIILISYTCNCRALEQEKFISISELRISLGDQSYGPSKSQIINKHFEDIIRSSKSAIVTTIGGTPNNDILLNSSYCISGFEIVQKGELYNFEINDQFYKLCELFSNYNSYGDRYMTVFQPNIAIEFLSKNGAVVLLFESKTKMGRFSDPVWMKNDAKLGSIVTFSGSVNKILNVVVESALSKKSLSEKSEETQSIKN